MHHFPNDSLIYKLKTVVTFLRLFVLKHPHVNANIGVLSMMYDLIIMIVIGNLCFRKFNRKRQYNIFKNFYPGKRFQKPAFLVPDYVWTIA